MKRLLILPVLVGLGVGLTGCFERDEKIYDGPRQVEFAPTRTGGLYARTMAQPSTAQGNAYTDSVVVQLIAGEPHTQPITVNFSVRDTTFSGSTAAVANTDYTLIDSGSITFQPGDYSVPIRFNVLRRTPQAATVRTLALILEGSSDAQPAQNYKRFTLSFAR